MKQWILGLLMSLPLAGQCQNYADVLIRNGRIIDGTGNHWYRADLAVKDGKIAAIGKLQQWTAAKMIDATGLIVAPGFIDVHTHIEGDEIKNPQATNFIYDGVTTVITGNCGASSLPMDRYFQFLDSLKLSVNTASFVGHNDVRKAVMGSADRLPTAAELEQMETIVAAAMQAGAVGFSTGLIYIPGTYAQTDEIIRLAKVAAQYQGVYATHMRDEADSVVQAIEEALHIGRAANIPVQISHFKISGQHNWGRSNITLPMIMQARAAGQDVTIDQYPYTASSTGLSTLLPDWVLADGQDSIKARLARPAIRAVVMQHLMQRLKKRKLKHYSYAVVAYYRPDTSYNGKSIEAINLLRGKKHRATEEAETIIELMENGGAQMVLHGMSEADVIQIMQYPFNMFASDASIRVWQQGRPHPRGYGTNARVLGRYVREHQVLSLEEGIRRMTALPALRFQLQERGILKAGYAADIVVFDPANVIDASSFEDPHQYSRGFHYVLVNGAITLSAGTHTGVRNGQVLRHRPE